MCVIHIRGFVFREGGEGTINHANVWKCFKFRPSKDDYSYIHVRCVELNLVWGFPFPLPV